ncbi:MULTISPECIES: NtrZ family periplasmic regulatory protein [Hyphomonas]|mgnify:CR=1 FL=1|jgi:hypothetical protein|uniref:Uncharacterized protein n=2 Tax=Hyphomonas atlantica TaxID=1280948 RepID=A0A059E775_9PROT|nr:MULTISPECIES: hypothetical protein [Hyphomonas]OUX83401.1 MAG: hypothetical protein CBB91_12460 [Hyphomonas sp. TMED31]KCZ63556.1 hypothetical protein HY36_14770 [Hyphomonas atlantica]MAH94009.1 hypothetical protein [Hyphomonas sp.]MAM08406.1 hypothetical protein [Hyphomonas sp.]HBH42816.1 hypothetical protein [Hyphomonas atlantica]|tara:strand:- start:48 stop:500 length:453 start_codon:yes stop_codon:yes gene_type:complete
MKLGFVTFGIALCAALAMPAAAQDSVPAPEMELAAPSISETSAAQSEWYRQFAQSKPASAEPVWQAKPDREFSMQFGSNTRWQLNLDKVSRTDLSPLPREEMQAGATFRITPRFSVGGEVSVGADELNDTSTWESREVEAGIRLKSAFKF